MGAAEAEQSELKAAAKTGGFLAALEGVPRHAHTWLVRRARRELGHGVPSCCAAFGVIYHHGGDRVHDDPRDQYEAFMDECGFDHYASDYVPCPRCLLEGKFVEVEPEDDPDDDWENEQQAEGKEGGARGIA